MLLPAFEDRRASRAGIPPPIDPRRMRPSSGLAEFEITRGGDAPGGRLHDPRAARADGRRAAMSGQRVQGLRTERTSSFTAAKRVTARIRSPSGRPRGAVATLLDRDPRSGSPPSASIRETGSSVSSRARAIVAVPGSGASASARGRPMGVTVRTARRPRTNGNSRDSRVSEEVLTAGSAADYKRPPRPLRPSRGAGP